MPRFHLTYETRFDFVVEADSAEEAQRAAEKLDPIRDFMDSPIWHVSAWPAPDGTPIDMGVADGELLSLHDYEKRGGQ